MAHTSLLKRANFDSSIRPFSPAQLSQKMALDHLNATIENPSFLSSMLVGSAAYRFSKWAFVEAASLSKLASLLPKPVLGASSTLFALSSEVTAFRSAHQILEKGYDTQFHKEVFERKAWLGTAIDFGSLKGIGILALNANPILRSTLQSAGMVAARDLSATLNISPAEPGTYVERLAQAQVTQWGIGAGIGLFHHLNSGRIQNHEIAARLKTEALLNPIQELSKRPSLPEFFPTMRSEEEELDGLGFPMRKPNISAANAEVPRTWKRFSPYHLDFFDPNRLFHNLIGRSKNFGEIGISPEHGLIRIADDGVKIFTLSRHPGEVLTDFEGVHIPKANLADFQRISEARYLERLPRFPVFAGVFWYFFINTRDPVITKSYKDHAMKVLKGDLDRFRFLTVNLKGEKFNLDFSTFKSARQVLASLIFAKRDNVEFQIPLMELFLKDIYERYGIDPLLFCLQMQNGMAPGYYLSYVDLRNTSDHATFAQGRLLKGSGKIEQLKQIPDVWTLDVFLELLARRPWINQFLPFNPQKVATAGALYTSYYEGERPQNLNDLYYALRRPNLDSRIISRNVLEAAELMTEPARRLITDPENTLILPMISNAAPTDAIGILLSKNLQIPVQIDAWRARPSDYANGVEGMTLAAKMEMLHQVLHLTETAQTAVRGREVIIVDDNITDAATFVSAQFILYAAGAKSVKLITLTSTIRDAQDLEGFRRGVQAPTVP